MDPQEFTTWLSGFAELHPAPPSAEQWAIICAELRRTAAPTEDVYTVERDKMDNAPFRNGRLVLKKNGVPYAAQG